MVDIGKRDRTGIGRGLRALAAGIAFACATPVSPAFADWKADVGKLRIGMVAKPGAGAAVAGVAELERSFSRALGFPVAVFVARDLPALIDAQASNRVDYAIYSATAYVVASRLCGCVEPLVAPVAADGATGARMVLILRAGTTGSGKAPRIAMVADEALPRALLARLGANALGPATASAVVEVPVASMEAAERLFVEGSVDGFYGWAPDHGAVQGAREGGSLARLAGAGVADAEIEIAWTSEPLRFGPHAVSSGLPGEVKIALRSLLIGLKDANPDVYDIVEEERQGGFSPVSAADYAILEALLAGDLLGVDADE